MQLTPHAVRGSLNGDLASGRRKQEEESSGRVGLSTARRFKMKICLLGDPAVGKTSLIRRFVHNEFDEMYLYTLGTKVSRKDVRVQTKSGSVSAKLLVWDIMGEKGFLDLLAGAYFEGADAAMAVADLTRGDTLDNLEGWVRSARKVAGQIPLAVMANKSDLVDDTDVPAEDVSEMASSLGGEHYITSAKTGENVDAAFEGLARTLVTEHGQDFFGG